MSWTRVAAGRSGAVVSRRQGVFRKETQDPTEDLRAEAARLVWLQARGIPVPEVLEVDREVLLTREVAGRTAGDYWPKESRPRVLEALARLTRDLHALRVDGCPFDRRLDAVIPQALEAQVDLACLDAERQGWDRDRLVGELLARRPTQEELVVCHGDLSLPNVLIDPQSFAINAVIDTGRLGVADRWTDLGIATRSLASAQISGYGQWAAKRYLDLYGVALDKHKCDYYRLLDEFF